jgi:hypothetical protein
MSAIEDMIARLQEKVKADSRYAALQAEQKAALDAALAEQAAYQPSGFGSRIGGVISDAAKIPGVGSALVVVTGGLSLLDKDLRDAATRDYLVGARFGAGGLDAPKIPPPVTGTPSTEGFEQSPTVVVTHPFLDWIRSIFDEWKSIFAKK